MFVRRLALAVALVAGPVALSIPVGGQPVVSTWPGFTLQASASAADDARGDRHAMPSAYAWLNDYTPSDTYNVVLVRGIGVKGVKRILGPTRLDLGEQTPAEAQSYMDDHQLSPKMVQVAQRGASVMVYLPYNFLPNEVLARLSKRGTAAGFVTTVELDTYVTVARRGRVIREFDAGFKPPRRGALPAERGLDWGARRQNIWATAWAFNERLTRTHLSQEWFEGEHPTYVLRSLS